MTKETKTMFSEKPFLGAAASAMQRAPGSRRTATPPLDIAQEARHRHGRAKDVPA